MLCKTWPHASRDAAKPARAAAQLLHQLPVDIVHAIMGRLVSNDAVKLGSLHSALRHALHTLPSLQLSVALDMDLSRIGGGRTRSETAAERRRQRRRDSFAAFQAAHPGVADEAVSVRLALADGMPEDVYYGANFDIDWLPLRSLKRLCMETNPHGVSHEVRAS